MPCELLQNGTWSVCYRGVRCASGNAVRRDPGLWHHCDVITRPGSRRSQAGAVSIPVMWCHCDVNWSCPKEVDWMVNMAYHSLLLLLLWLADHHTNLDLAQRSLWYSLVVFHEKDIMYLSLQSTVLMTSQWHKFLFKTLLFSGAKKMLR